MRRQQFNFNNVTHRFEAPERGIGYYFLRYGLPAILAIVLSLGIRSTLGKQIRDPKEGKLTEKKQELISGYASIEARIAELEKALDEMQQRDDNIYRSFYEMDPIPRSMREAGHGGAEQYTNLQGYESSDLMTGLTQRVDKADVGLEIQENSFNSVITEAENHIQLIAHKPSIQPISLSEFYWISSVYGHRTDPISKKRAMHQGLDFAARVGRNVYATGDGVVIRAKESKGGFGREVLVDHGFGFITRYGHLNTIDVHVGQNVKRGTVVGTIGSTGKSTGPHLHYEVRRYGRALDPKQFYAEDLTPDEYSEIINESGPVDN